MQKVHLAEHVSLNIYTCLKVGRRALGPLLDAKQAATIFLVSNVKRYSNGVFSLSVFDLRPNQFLKIDSYHGYLPSYFKKWLCDLTYC